MHFSAVADFYMATKLLLDLYNSVTGYLKCINISCHSIHCKKIKTFIKFIMWLPEFYCKKYGINCFGFMDLT